MNAEPEYDDAFFDALIADHDAKAKKRKKIYGKKLHAEMKAAFRALPGCRFIVDWDDLQVPVTARPGDLHACIPPGLSVLIECKETRSDTIGFARIDDLKFSKVKSPKNNQRLSLLKHALSGGLSLIAVQRVWSNSSRTWLLSFQHWEHLRRELPRESIPLTDALRPTSLTEVGRSRSGDFFSSFGETVAKVRAESLTLPLIDYRY